MLCSAKGAGVGGEGGVCLLVSCCLLFRVLGQACTNQHHADVSLFFLLWLCCAVS